MGDWTLQLANQVPVRKLDDNLDIFLLSNSSGPEFYLKRMTLSSQAEADKQRDRERLGFGLSHQSIIETLEVTIESDKSHWYVYTLTPYHSSMSDDISGKKSTHEYYDPDLLWGYMKELVAAFAFLQEKVRGNKGYRA